MITFTLLSDDERTKLLSSNSRPSEWRAFIEKYFSPKDKTWSSEVNKLSLLFYIDSSGDFTSQKTPQAILANAIYNSLEKDDQRQVMSYLMWSES